MQGKLIKYVVKFYRRNNKIIMFKKENKELWLKHN